MRDFIAVFLGCLVICGIVTVFFVGFIFPNIWGIIIFIALFSAVFITIFLNQAARIKNLEEKVENLSTNKQE